MADRPKRIDALLEQVAAEYRQLDFVPARKSAFRGALSRLQLPGGYAVKGAPAQTFAQAYGQRQLRGVL